MDLSRFRKLISLIITAAVVYVMQLLGFGVTDLAAVGFGLSDISGPIVDYLVLYGIPAVVMAAQPDGDDDRSLWSQWRWWLGGAGLLAGLVVVVSLVL